MKRGRPRRPLAVACIAVGLCAASATQAQPSTYLPVKWERFVKVEGQPLPVPEQWLDTEEARIAHSLKLPEAVPKPKPFNFKAAGDGSWFTTPREVAGKYFDHLCASEAGQWIFKTVKNVEGLYLARPQAPPTTDMLTDPYGLEMPWIQRTSPYEELRWTVAWLIDPPYYNYHFVEQPRRSVDWQKEIEQPFIRLFGLKNEVFVAPGQVVATLNVRTPLQIVGIAKPAARYGYTWRGLRRERDREFNIAGGEVLIYDRQTSDVIAVRRQFLIASRNARGKEKTMWEIAASCPQLPDPRWRQEFGQFAFDVLQTIEPSTTGK